MPLVDRAVRRADARMVLPKPPETALSLSPDLDWTEALRLAAIDVVAADGGPELVVAPASRRADAVAVGAPMVILEGSGATRELRRAGYEVARYLVLPDVHRPELIVPVGSLRVARYAMARRTAGASSPRRALVQLAAVVSQLAPTIVRRSAVVTVGSRIGLQPFALRAAQAFGVESGRRWQLHLGPYVNHSAQRLAFLVFERREAKPSWAVKVVRNRGQDDGFDRDEIGLTALRVNVSREVARHAPELLGRSSVGGLPLSVETAAVGDHLVDALRRDGERRLPLVGAIAEWLIALARETCLPPEHLEPARGDLEREIMVAWSTRAPVADLFARTALVPAVLVHGDVGTWNILADGMDFTVVDWESTVRAGFPLWDLLYFLADACAQIDRCTEHGQRADYLLALFRGEGRRSPFVFDLVRRAVAATGTPATEVGVIATLGWLHRTALYEELGEEMSDAAPVMDEMVRFTEMWLADPDLGPSWSRWLSGA